jgi:hypothetical protein
VLVLGVLLRAFWLDKAVIDCLLAAVGCRANPLETLELRVVKPSNCLKIKPSPKRIQLKIP